MSAFPRFETVPLHEVPKDDMAGEQKKRAPLVLVVDDERVIADTLSIILKKNGFIAMTAYNGESALKMALETSPDLLLSDVMMGPGIDGTELAMAIIKACPECKVLLFSGHSATRDLLEKAHMAGHNFTLLSKPLHPADLLERLKDTFQGKVPAGAVQQSAASAESRASHWG